ncbi:hypothetical protein SE37_03575 [Geobacter soli]|uniref:Uncharacterized protein n=2 Tax=Geobacter soli TaxID=1510391 RepID=A0A0C1QMB8_9BACT|nr:hypothetical protein SE37_03575 [Geobacter soli]
MLILIALVMACMATAVGVFHLASRADDGLLTSHAEPFSFSVPPTASVRYLDSGGRRGWETLYTMDLVYEMFEGTGVEHRTLDTLCRQLDMDPQHARHTLRQRGVTIRPAETLGTAARRYGVNPIALLQALLVGEEVRSGQRRIEEVPRLRLMP